MGSGSISVWQEIGGRIAVGWIVLRVLVVSVWTSNVEPLYASTSKISFHPVLITESSQMGFVCEIFVDSYSIYICSPDAAQYLCVI